MQVEVWSDVVCPWCYIGKRRLESALEQFPHRDQVEVVWRSFQLDPSVPEGETHPTLPALAAKYGSQRRGDARQHGPRRGARRRPRAWTTTSPTASAATPCSPTSCCTSPPSTACATSSRSGCCTPTSRRGARSSTSTRSSRSPSRSASTRPRSARRWPTAATWPPSAQDGATAQALGATGVPFFVVDRKYGAAGAQPAELLLQILERAWAEAQPADHACPRRRGLRRRQLRRLSQPSSFGTRAQRLLRLGVQLADDVRGRPLGRSPARPTRRRRAGRWPGRRSGGRPRPAAGRRRRSTSSSSRPCHVPAEVVDQRAARPALRPGDALGDVEGAGQHRLVARGGPDPFPRGGRVQPLRCRTAAACRSRRRPRPRRARPPSRARSRSRRRPPPAGRSA